MLEDESGDESESEPLGFDSLSELEELSGLSTDDDLNIAEDSTETLDELIGDSDDDDFELDAESTDLLDDFLDSELSDDGLSADEAPQEFRSLLIGCAAPCARDRSLCSYVVWPG